MIKQYGFVEPEYIEEKEFILGALPQIPLVPDGQWDKWLPEYECQNVNYETCACTVFGTQNALETLLKFLTGRDFNYSERYNAIISGVRCPGANPHFVIEDMRKEGVIDQRELPMPDTYGEFLSPDPMEPSYLVKGQHWLRDWIFGHEWVMFSTPEDREIKMKEALTYSPLGISVTAWIERDGVYVDDGKPNSHWCVCYGWNKKGWKVFDSYDHSKKIVSYSHNIGWIKRFYVTPNEGNKRKQRPFLLKAIDSLINWIASLTAQVETERRLVEAEIEAPSKTPAERLYDIAYSYIGEEASPKDVAPDEVACADSASLVIRDLYPDFPHEVSTLQLYNRLKAHPRFKETKLPKPGVVIISPTGTGNGSIPGHVGICGKTHIMSNQSATNENGPKGTWQANFTLDTWRERYVGRGGFKIFLFEPC